MKQRVTTTSLIANWNYDWHFKCTIFLFTEFNWPVAATYDRLNMESWTDIDVKALADSRAFRKGNYERACEPFTRERAINGAKRRNHPEDKLVSDNNIWCDFCATWGKHKVKDCRKKLKAEGKG